MRPLWISNKRECNTAKNWLNVPCLTLREFRADMHQAFRVNCHHTKYSAIQLFMCEISQKYATIMRNGNKFE